MRINKKEVLKRLMSNEYIKDLTSHMTLTEEILNDAISILLVMEEESEQDLDVKTTFEIEPGTNAIIRKRFFTEKGWSKEASKNIVSFPATSFLTWDTDVDFFKSEERKTLINWFAKNSLNGDSKKGAYLCGSSHVGKTFLMKFLAFKSAHAGKSVGFIYIPDFFSYIKECFSTKQNYYDKINTFKNVDVLFLDDIGSESIAPWFRDEILMNIINYRFENGLPTFYSSNYNYEQLAKNRKPRN